MKKIEVLVPEDVTQRLENGCSLVEVARTTGSEYVVEASISTKAPVNFSPSTMLIAMLPAGRSIMPNTLIPSCLENRGLATGKLGSRTNAVLTSHGEIGCRPGSLLKAPLGI